MKLQRSTVILMAVAIALGGVVLITETLQFGSDGGGVAQKSGDRLFAFEEAQVKTLKIERQGETVEFERDAEDVWQMTAPESARAEQASIAFLLSLITTEPSRQTLTISPDQLADFGLTRPIGAIEMTLDNGDTHTLVLGAEDFSGGSLYVQVDPASDPAELDGDEIEVQVAAIDLINGVERPLEDWKAPVDEPETAADSTSVPDSDAPASADAASPAPPPTPDSSPAPPENSPTPPPEASQ